MPEYADEELQEQWLRQKLVLDAKEEECRQRLAQQEISAPNLHDPVSGGHIDNMGANCDALWDSVLCWPAASPDTLLRAPCPDYIVGFNEEAEATRYCTPESGWFVHPDTNNTWTNYSLCATGPFAWISIEATQNVSSSLQLWLPAVKRVAQLGYGVSLVTLMASFLILALSKRLRCPRNTLHRHLFASFILRAAMALLKDSLFVRGVGLPSDVTMIEGKLEFLPDKDNWACKLVTSLWQFCIMANYSWILMEGLYLHNLIFLALFTDSSAITLYVVLGWGLPVLVVVPWVALRATMEDTYCWTTHQSKALLHVIKMPIIVSVLVNFILFLNIVRVLLLKLKASQSVVRRKARYGKWARSTLVLVPLFGVHYALSLGMAYWLGPTLEILWIFFDQLFASFQGFFVSLLYCLLNGEVRLEMARRWRAMGCYCCGIVSTGDGRQHPQERMEASCSLLQLSRRSRGASLPEHTPPQLPPEQEQLSHCSC